MKTLFAITVSAILLLSLSSDILIHKQKVRFILDSEAQ